MMTGWTGLIFGGIAVAWLVYLVPYFLHRRGLPEDDVDVNELMAADSVTIVRSGVDLSSADEGVAEVSTPQTRQEQLGELHRAEIQAARRRRLVLILLGVVQVAAVVLVVLGFGRWWDALIPLVLIGVFLVVARVSVAAMRRDLARRAERIDAASDEPTVAIRLTPQDAAQYEHPVELSEPIGVPGSLWEPIPITRPTYVSTPLAPRTVRTIDLAPPATSQYVPVLADILEQLDAEERAEDHRDRDVG